MQYFQTRTNAGSDGSLSTMTVQSGDLDRYKALVGVRFVPYE